MMRVFTYVLQNNKFFDSFTKIGDPTWAVKAEKTDVKIPFHSFRERQFFCHFIINIVLNLQWANELQSDAAWICIFFLCKSN